MDILDLINDGAEQLKNVVEWHGSGMPIAEVDLKPHSESSPDYIYEFYCLIRIVNDLNHFQRVYFEEGTGPFRISFPRSPANKKGKPYFLVYDRASDPPKKLFQICAGVKIRTIHDMNRAPDISFQTAEAPENPKWDHVGFIFDAKNKRADSNSNQLGQNEFSYVTQMIRDLKLDASSAPRIAMFRFQELAGLEANCILTNGSCFAAPKAYFEENNIKIAAQFDKGLPFEIFG